MIRELQLETFKDFQIPSGVEALDIGANEGQWSRELVKGFQRVIAVEPCGLAFEKLSRLVVKNPPLWTYRFVAWSNDIRVQFREDQTNTKWSEVDMGIELSGHYLTKDHDWHEHSMEAWRIDTYFGDRNLDFIKCDVEGG